MPKRLDSLAVGSLILLAVALALMPLVLRYFLTAQAAYGDLLTQLGGPLAPFVAFLLGWPSLGVVLAAIVISAGLVIKELWFRPSAATLVINNIAVVLLLGAVLVTNIAYSSAVLDVMAQLSP